MSDIETFIDKFTRFLYPITNLPLEIILLYARWLYTYLHYEKFPDIPHIVYHQEVYLYFPVSPLFHTLYEYRYALKELQKRGLLTKLPGKHNFFKPFSFLVQFSFSPEVEKKDFLQASNVPDNEIYIENYMDQLISFLGEESNAEIFS